MEIIGVKEVLAKWEIEDVKQVIDILGLWGDAVDNIPGIPGIGEKTAKLLIKQYGSVENIIANAHELKGKQRENVEMYAEQGMVSKKLATIILDVPVEFDEKLWCWNSQTVNCWSLYLLSWNSELWVDVFLVKILPLGSTDCKWIAANRSFWTGGGRSGEQSESFCGAAFDI